MNHKKPAPLSEFDSTRPRCPVCGEVSYSKDGIHPQCSQALADSKRMERLKVKDDIGSKTPAAKKPRHWEKQCPSCRMSVHVRKKTCDCGHSFA